MADQYDWWNSVVAARSVQGTEDDWLSGNTLLSAETAAGEFSEKYVAVLAQEDTFAFLKYSKLLPEEQREVLLPYILLGITQTVLGKATRMTQTVVSSAIEMAQKQMGFFVLIGGKHPDEATLRQIFTTLGVEEVEFPHRRHWKPARKVSFAYVVYHYAKHGSFAKIAKKFDILRAAIRKKMVEVHTRFIDSHNPIECGVAAYLYGLYDGKSPDGVGLSRAKLKRVGDIYKSDPDLLGDFRIRIEDENFERAFQSKSTAYFSEEED